MPGNGSDYELSSLLLHSSKGPGMLGLAHEPAPGVGVGVGAVVVGLVLILLGIAYLTDYKRIASRVPQGDITGWQSAPKVLARYFAPRVAKTPVWHYRIFGG